MKSHPLKNKTLHHLAVAALLCMPCISFSLEIVPSGLPDDCGLIQSALNVLHVGDTIRLKGNFKLRKTVYLPSDITWVLDGSLSLADNSVLDEAGVVEPGIDSRRPTAITEKSGGASSISMSGGTYEGNASGNAAVSVRLINFVKVTNSTFSDMTIQNASDDNFTIGPKSSGNVLRRIISRAAGGNALTDKGDANTWYDCIAERCASDGWTPKCRNSTFYRCIGRYNAGPGFGCFSRLDGANPSQGEIITGNKFFACEAYGNERGGISFNIASTSGPGSIIRNNFIQGIFYDNGCQGVTFRNKQVDGIIANNKVDILVYGNKSLSSGGTLLTAAGGLGIEGSPVTGITGCIVGYDNAGYDVNIQTATGCTLTVLNPDGINSAVINKGGSTNIVQVAGFSCPQTTSDCWCRSAYCTGASTSIFRHPSPEGRYGNKTVNLHQNSGYTSGAYLLTGKALLYVGKRPGSHAHHIMIIPTNTDSGEKKPSATFIGR